MASLAFSFLNGSFCILANNGDMHTSLTEFEFPPALTTDDGVRYPLTSKNRFIHFF